MKYQYIIQADENIRIKYKIEYRKITATMNGKTDVFDFTGFPEGRISEIQSELEFVPVREVEILDNVLYCKLVKLVDPSELKDFEENEEYIEFEEDLRWLK